MINKEALREMAYAGAERLYGEVPVERMEHELGVINDCGFTDYFLVLKKIFDEAKRRDIYLSPSGRGSAGGSVVAYCLGFIGLDPIKHHLPFERFLNRERVSPPD